MEFDQLLRKYLAGSISDVELQRFRDLLDRSPEYRVELRQVLELRSLIQDDALGLAPPDDLTEHTRQLVAERFAGERVIRREDEERRRRAGIFPFRIAAGVMATTFVVMMVAIGPSMIERFGDRSVGNAPAIAEVKGGGSAAMNSAPQLPQNSVTIDQTDAAASVALPSRAEGRTATSMRQAARERHQMAHSAEPVIATDATLIEERSSESRMDQTSVSQSLVLRDDPMVSAPEDEALRERLSVQMHSPIRYQPQRIDRLSSADEAEAAASPEVTTLPALPGEPPRRLMIGLMLGSGRVTETTAPTPVIQNSYYFAFSLTDNDRIGLEMGSSAFQQARSVATFTSVASNGLAKGGSDERGSASKLTSADAGSGDTQNGLSSQKRMTLVEQRAEQQITYGTVFYDRRMKVTEKWDICARLGLGAADNALVGHVRAYGAFSPSKNVTLTFGVGGSGLQPLSRRSSDGSSDGSGNYGIYYGIETGF